MICNSASKLSWVKILCGVGYYIVNVTTYNTNYICDVLNYAVFCLDSQLLSVIYIRYPLLIMPIEDRGGGEPPRNVGVYRVILNESLWPYNDRGTITIFYANGY